MKPITQTVSVSYEGSQRKKKLASELWSEHKTAWEKLVHWGDVNLQPVSNEAVSPFFFHSPYWTAYLLIINMKKKKGLKIFDENSEKNSAAPGTTGSMKQIILISY